jgi:DNA repair protein SbcC/Rad50
MRLHTLDLEAFGPFAEPTHVDFDALSASGLFLLCGPTGAGKTSVLDAVCFALFGQVPGDRDKARRLRSDHAAAATGPRVVLEVTLRGRRLRVTRSPEWQRPKKRGTGFVREHTKVLVEERVEGAWQQHTNRVDEAGDLLGRLVGLTMTQFCQVALLPQGRFETFLRCGAHERHALLERLFGTHRFRAVEEWLADRRRALGRESDEHAGHVGEVLARVAEAAGVDPLPEPGPGDCLAWAGRLREAATATLTDATTRRHAADQQVKDTRAALEHARDLADRQQRHLEARRRLDALRAVDDDTRRRADEVDRARRAEPVLPLVDLGETSAARLAEAERGLAAARALVGEPDDPGAEPSEAVLARLRAHAQALVALQPVQRRLVAVGAELERLGRDLEMLVVSSGRLQQECEARAQRLTATRAEHTEAVAAADAIDALDEQVRRARTVAEAAGRLPGLRQERAAAEAARLDAVDAALRAREQWLDLRQARLDGMAGELATVLRRGEPCAVCGSREHPAPAAAADRISADREQQSEERWRVAEEAVRVATTTVAEHDRVLAVAAAEAEGADRQEAADAVTQLTERLDRVRSRAGRTGALQAEAAGLEAADGAARRRLQEQQAEHATLTERRELRRAERAGLRQQVHEATGGADLDACLEDARESLRRWERLADCERAAAARRQAHEEAACRAHRALRDAGFAGEADVRAAALPPTALANLETLLRRRADERAAVHAVLDDPAVADAAAQPPVDTAPLLSALAEHEAARDAMVAQERAAQRCVGRLEALHTDLAGALTAWAPVREALAVTERMASLCAGTSADNRHRMRLSAYVLAARLEQVVEAANARLLLMSSDRYTLRHSVERGVGDRRGGLGLQVHDGWTGDLRDPATLSGGETFFTSLALALGLADVVAHEAGGAEVDTLFVDEGFGALDPDTLDEVMDVLDQLRSGGRAVGLVSHVADLRARIPAQVHVRKTRSGSTLAAS